MKIAIKYQSSIITTIKQRRSIRTYRAERIEKKKQSILQKAANFLSKNSHRFTLIEMDDLNNRAEQLSTFGVIKGAKTFLIGILPGGTKRDKEAVIHFGYDFEQLVLKATELGLGTCWIAGTFNPLSFKKSAALKKGEKIVMISPIGSSAEKMHLVSAISSRAAHSKSRKSWETLFFNGSIDVPLSKRDAGKYATALEMVRLAPSAVNTQPWRVIRRDDDFHFFAEKTRYYHLIRSNFLCRNDLGIALAHFELTCRELGLEGNWIIDKESNDTFPGWEYIRTWKGN